MVDLIIDRYGAEAIARIAAAYRDGASDAEALEAGTGIPADELYADYFAAFGVDAPQPIEPGADRRLERRPPGGRPRRPRRRRPGRPSRRRRPGAGRGERGTT